MVLYFIKALYTVMWGGEVGCDNSFGDEEGKGWGDERESERGEERGFDERVLNHLGGEERFSASKHDENR